MTELNPQHPTTQAMSGQWHKLLAIVMCKLAQRHIVVDVNDITAVEGLTVALQELTDGIHIRLIDQKEAEQLLAEHGNGEIVRTELAFPESQIEREISQGLTQKQIAMTYALALQIKSKRVDWARINMAILNKWGAKALNRIKDMAHTGSCFKKK
jgi:FixJ family two-component response regulator